MRRILAAPLAVCTALGLSVLPAAAAHAASTWTETTSYLEGTLGAGEGVATVDPPGSSAYELYRGIALLSVLTVQVIVRRLTDVEERRLRTREQLAALPA